MINNTEDLSNLNPSTNREWLIYLSRSLDDLKECQAEDSETLANFMKEIREWKTEHDKRDREVAEKRNVYFDRTDHLERTVSTWNWANSIVGGIALALGAIAAIFRK